MLGIVCWAAEGDVLLVARLPLAVATLSVLGHEHGERALRSWAVP